MKKYIVLDTNVIVGALIKPTGANRAILRLCLQGVYCPLMGTALFFEYESLLSRSELFEKCPLNATERSELLDAIFGCCEWVSAYFSWRPNLPDEGDNHIVELALAGGAEMIVTNNVKDFQRSDLLFPGIEIIPPHKLLKRRN